jgi:hypothetical protein
MSDYFKKSSENSNRKPFMTNWAFAMYDDNAQIYREEGECYRIGEFASEYIKSIWRSGRDDIIVPKGIHLSGEIFGHNKFHDGSSIATSFIKTIKVIERDGIGAQYCATTEGGRDYYFHSKDSSELFDRIMNEVLVRSDHVLNPDSKIVPLVILSEED